MADAWDQFQDAPADPWAQFADGGGAGGGGLGSPTLGQRAKALVMPAVGGAELLLSGATSLPASAIAGLGGLGTMAANPFREKQVDPAETVNNLRQQLTYAPRSDSAQAGAEMMGRGLGWLGSNVADPMLEKIGAVSPTAENVVRTAAPALAEAATTALPLGRAVTGGAFRVADGAAQAASRMPATVAEKPAPPPKPAPQTAEDIVARVYGDSQQSMGAASAAPKLTEVSPELKEAIVGTAQRTGGAINPEVLARHVEADSLPVRIRLSRGEATQDPVLLSEERNRRGKDTAFAQRMDETNKKLGQNVQAIRDEVGPDVFSTNQVEHADTVMSSYRAKNDVAQQEISKRYKALRDANGGQFPIDAKALYESAAAQLHQQLLFDHAPPAVMKTLTRLAESNKMTFENFESLRTNLARIQRSNPDGNVVAAAGVIRGAMEALPLAQGAAKLKPLADSARAAAKAQFDALEADPAYKAAVMESVPPDRFMQRYVLGGTRDNVALMRQNLADDDRALQTLGVATLDYLRDAAKLNPHYEGNFAAPGYTKALQNLSPKLASLLSPKAAEQLEKLGNVARYTTFQPRGSYVNNSNTFVAAAADKAAKAAEKIGNVAVPGLDLGTMARERVDKVKSAKETKRALAPGAGLDELGTRH